MRVLLWTINVVALIVSVLGIDEHSFIIPQDDLVAAVTCHVDHLGAEVRMTVIGKRDHAPSPSIDHAAQLCVSVQENEIRPVPGPVYRADDVAVGSRLE